MPDIECGRFWKRSVIFFKLRWPQNRRCTGHSDISNFEEHCKVREKLDKFVKKLSY